MADPIVTDTSGTPPIVPGAPPIIPAAWYGTQDTEMMGYMQARGYDKLTPDKAALAAMQAHREAEKLIGAPADQMQRWPKDAADLEGWNKVHTRLGVPATGAEYDLTAVKRSDGEALDEGETTTIKQMAKELNLPKDVAPVFAQKLVALADKANAAMEADYTAKLAVEKETLAKNWGNNAANFKIVAENAAKAMGFDAEMLAALERTVGHAKVMEGFRQIGVKTGEAQFISGSNDKSLPMTREEATYKLVALESDTLWWDKFQKGDVATQTEFNNLTRIKAGAPSR